MSGDASDYIEVTVAMRVPRYLLSGCRSPEELVEEIQEAVQPAGFDVPMTVVHVEGDDEVEEVTMSATRFALVLNPVTARAEYLAAVATARTLEALQAWEAQQRAAEPYDDEHGYHCVYAKDSPLARFNPPVAMVVRHDPLFGRVEDHGGGVVPILSRRDSGLMGKLQAEATWDEQLGPALNVDDLISQPPPSGG